MKMAIFSDQEKLAKKNDDCYFYYNRKCNKGDLCPYRHEPTAIDCQITCRYWIYGICTKPNCAFRHMNMQQVPRTSVYCYYESTPGGCRKIDCTFLHNKDQSADSEGLQEHTVSPQSSRSNSPTFLRRVSVVITASDLESDLEDDNFEMRKRVAQSLEVMKKYEDEINILNQVQEEQAAKIGYQFLPEEPEQSPFDNEIEYEKIIEEEPIHSSVSCSSPSHSVFNRSAQSLSQISTIIGNRRSLDKNELYSVDSFGHEEENSSYLSSPDSGLHTPNSSIFSSSNDSSCSFLNSTSNSLNESLTSEASAKYNKIRKRRGGLAGTLISQTIGLNGVSKRELISGAERIEIHTRIEFPEEKKDVYNSLHYASDVKNRCTRVIELNDDTPKTETPRQSRSIHSRLSTGINLNNSYGYYHNKSSDSSSFDGIKIKTLDEIRKEKKTNHAKRVSDYSTESNAESVDRIKRNLSQKSLTNSSPQYCKKQHLEGTSAVSSAPRVITLNKTSSTIRFLSRR